MNAIDGNGLLLQMRALAARAQGGVSETASPQASGGVDFSRVLRGALDSVNNTQQTARSLADQYRRFIPEPVHDVVLSGGGAHNPTLVRLIEAATQVMGRNESHQIKDAKLALVQSGGGWANLRGCAVLSA